MANPQLSVKGKILNSNNGAHTYGMDGMLQLPADRRDAAGNTISGGDAKLLEMDGNGLKIGMEMWVEKVKNWTLESMSLSRKDPHTLKGTMSGTAIMLIDEDFYDFVEGLKDPYGDMGILEVIKLLCKMLIQAKHPKFAGISPDSIDEIQLSWPRMYEPDPTELLAMQQALTGARDSGFMNTEEGSQVLAAALDKDLTPTEPEANPLLALPGQAQQDDKDFRGKEFDLKDKGAPKPAIKPKTK